MYVFVYMCVCNTVCLRECLRDHILAFHDADVLCPCNEGYDCKGSVTELEMRAVCQTIKK